MVILEKSWVLDRLGEGEVVEMERVFCRLGSRRWKGYVWEGFVGGALVGNRGVFGMIVAC